MNERILELAQQAGINQDQDEDGTRFLSMPESSWEKFAELLIRECARVASDYDGAHYVGTAIELHFGVE